MNTCKIASSSNKFDTQPRESMMCDSCFSYGEAAPVVSESDVAECTQKWKAGMKIETGWQKQWERCETKFLI